MKRRQYCFSVIRLFLLTLPVVSVAHAQLGDYPQKPVMIISDAAAGTAPDTTARFVAKGLGEIWRQQVVVVNRPGGNGNIAARAASDSAADGYTLFMPSLSTFAALPTVAPNLPVSSRAIPADWIHGRATDVHHRGPGPGITTLPQLIELAKRKPGEISIAVSGIGRLTISPPNCCRRGPISGSCGSLYAQHDIPARRRRLQSRIRDRTKLFGDRRGGRMRTSEANGRGFTGTSTRVSDLPTVAETIPGFSATGGRFGGANRHARADYRQGERSSKQSGRRCGL